MQFVPRVAVAMEFVRGPTKFFGGNQTIGIVLVVTGWNGLLTRTSESQMAADCCVLPIEYATDALPEGLAWATDCEVASAPRFV